MKTGFAFNLIQELFSKTYGWTTGSDPYPLRTLLKCELKRLSPRKILDVGCGSGCYAMPGFNYIGIDPNPHYIAYCRRNRADEFAEMSGTKLRFRDRRFDVVLCFSVGHHLPDSALVDVLKEVRRVLSDDGVFLFADVVTPITNSPMMSKILEALDEGDSFRSETDYRRFLEAEFDVQSQQELIDQFYRTVLFRCCKK